MSGSITPAWALQHLPKENGIALNARQTWREEREGNDDVLEA